MAGTNEATAQEVKEAVDALREETEKYGADSAEAKEMAEKIEKKILEDEKAHQEAIAELQESCKQALEMEERIKDLELELVKGAQSPLIDYKELPAYKALQSYCKHGEVQMPQDELGILVDHKKTMRMDDATAGGYLTTTEMDPTIIKKITEISPVRQVARVKTVSKKTLEVVVRTSIPTAAYEGEAEQGQDSQSAYGNEQLTTYRLSTTVPFTMDVLMDSNWDLEAEINADVVEAFAYTEGNKFVLGTGAKQPEGFLVNPTVVANTRTTATAGTIEGDDLILLTGDLKVGYNPMYGFNRQTLAFLRTLKTEDGHYIWQAGLAPNVPNTLNGEPYVVFQDMPSIAANSLSVVYADFLRGYTITDRTGMMIIRDDVTKKRQAIVELTFHRWNTGQVALPEAFKVLKTKAA